MKRRAELRAQRRAAAQRQAAWVGSRARRARAAPSREAAKRPRAPGAACHSPLGYPQDRRQRRGGPSSTPGRCRRFRSSKLRTRSATPRRAPTAPNCEGLRRGQRQAARGQAARGAAAAPSCEAAAACCGDVVVDALVLAVGVDVDAGVVLVALVLVAEEGGRSDGGVVAMQRRCPTRAMPPRCPTWAGGPSQWSSKQWVPSRRAQRRAARSAAPGGGCSAKLRGAPRQAAARRTVKMS